MINIVALDLGSSFLRLVVAQYNEISEIEILIFKEIPSKGIRGGVIINIEEVVDNINYLLQLVKKEHNFTVRKVYVSISNLNIESYNSRGVAAVTGRNNEITLNDIEKVMEGAQAIMLPIGKEVLHVLPQDYTIDGTKNIKNPLAMIGVRLEVDVHVILNKTALRKNIESVLVRSNLEMEGIVLSVLAAGHATSFSDEREQGLILVEIGSSQTHVLVFLKSSVFASFSVPIAGDRVTLDIAQLWGIREDEAERIKIDYGTAFPGTLVTDENLIIWGSGSQASQLKSQVELSYIIAARMTELLQLIKEKLDNIEGIDVKQCNFVFTGGGSAMVGLVDLSESLLHRPSRIGLPFKIKGLDEKYTQTRYCTCLGIVFFLDLEYSIFQKESRSKQISFSKEKSMLARFLRWLKMWI